MVAFLLDHPSAASIRSSFILRDSEGTCFWEHTHTVTQSKITAGFHKYAHDWVRLTAVFTANTPSYRHQNNRRVECWLWALKCRNERREYLMAYQAQYGSLLFRLKLKKPLSCPAVSKSTSNVALCPQKLCGLLGKGSARRPSRLSHRY